MTASSPERASLDAWLPSPAVCTRHVRRADAPPDALWAAAQEVRLRDTRVLGRLVRWRIPGTPVEQRFVDLFTSYPFTVLDQGERHLISGLCGRIWTLHRDYPRLAGPEDFCNWDERGTVRVAFGHWVTDDSELITEARVEPVDRRAAMRLRALWAVVGRFSGVIASEPLPIAVRRAERA